MDKGSKEMKITLDIKLNDGTESKDWMIDLSKPLPSCMGDLKARIRIFNICIENEGNSI